MRHRPKSGCALLMAACLFPAFANDADDSRKAARTEPATPDLYSLDLESLLNIKVTTASKFSEKLSDAPGVMSVVSRDELHRFGGLTLREILERVPGLAGSIASFTDRSIVAARGDQTRINGGHILFLINGRPSREVLEGGLIGDLLESFPVNILERIEIIKGPGSVLYGSNAFSAVVNLITQKAHGTELMVTGMGTGGSGFASSGNVMWQRGAFSLVGATQFHQNPEWITPVWSPVGGQQTIDIPDRGKGAYLEADYKGLSLMSSFTELTTFYTEGAVGEARWRRGFADLGYHLRPGRAWDMSFNLTYTRSSLDAQRSIPFITRDSHEVVIEWTNMVSLGRKDRLTFGTLFNHIHGMEYFFGVTPGEAIADGGRAAGAFYAQLDHQLTDNLKVIGGFQANKISSISFNVVPRAGLIWNPMQRVAVKALYSQAFRAPSINETMLHYVPPPSIGGPSLLGSPGLSPEKVATVDIGIGYQGNRFQAGVDYFHSRQSDNIIPADVTTTGRYVNLGQTTFQGVELDGKYYIRKSLLVMGSTLYQTNRDGDGNRNVTPISNFGAKAGVSYESPRGFTAGLFDVFQGPIHGYSASINPRPSAYQLLDANIRFDLAQYLPTTSGRGLALLVHADNLIGKQIWLPDWKDNPGDSTFSNRGRTIYFGVEMTLRRD